MKPKQKIKFVNSMKFFSYHRQKKNNEKSKEDETFLNYKLKKIDVEILYDFRSSIVVDKTANEYNFFSSVCFIYYTE